MNSRTQCWLSVLVVLVVSGATGWAQQELQVGPWTARVGPDGLYGLAWRGETIITRGGMTGYLPEWKGTRFALTGADLTVTPTGAVWHKSEPGNQEATITLTLSEEQVQFTLDTTVFAAGPSEWSVTVRPEAVRASEEHCTVWVNGRLRTLLLSAPLDTINGISQMRFEQPDRTVALACDSLQMQDRRAQGGGFFFVRVLGSSGAGPVHYQHGITLRVIEADPATIPGRRQFISQRSARATELELKNPGFEAGDLSGWAAGAIAAADATEPAEGKWAARMRIESARTHTGSPYLVQTVPAVPGRLYRAEALVRGEEVRPAVINNMPPAGATVIIEFADAEGKWLAAGSYGAPNYGSFPWKRVSTEPARAPKGAGRAIIYLALRGEGTAWFDQVRCLEVEYPILLAEPMDGAQVHDNTPRFDWYYEPRSETVLELSRDQEFPEAATVRLPATVRPPVQVTEPLPPGIWYWRVRDELGETVSAVWSFTQTARTDEDTTEPSIAECHAWLPEARAPMIIRCADNVGVAQITLTVDGEDVSARVQMGPTEARYVPAQDWAQGLHRVHALVRDAAGNSAERDLYFTHTPHLPTIQWLTTGGVAVDGERQFLLGMYGINIEHMPEMAAAGIDYVHSYAWDGAGRLEDAIAYLDAAVANGLRVFMGLERAKLMEGNEEFVAERVAALMAHPGLLCWYLFDEPDLKHQYVPPAELARLYRLIKALDPFHPVVVTCAGDAAVPLYADAMDVHWTQVYGATDFVARRLERHRELLPPGKPISAILHCYDRTQSGLPVAERDPEKFQPDGTLMRANAFMALAHNSSCLSWWWWGYGGGERFMTVANSPKDWAALKQIIADIIALRPVLTGEGEVHTSVIEADGAQVHVWEKRLADRTIIIAVNRDPVECDVQMRPATVPAGATLSLLFEEGRAQMQGEVLAAHFGPRAVHVYQWSR